MTSDERWPATVLSVVPSYSHTNSNLIGNAQSGFPMSWFFSNARTTYVPVNSTRPQNPSLPVFHPKWQKGTSDHESDGRLWSKKPKFLFAFHSYHRSILLSLGNICVQQSDRRTDRQGPLLQLAPTLRLWRFDLYQRALSEEACSILHPNLGTVVMRCGDVHTCDRFLATLHVQLLSIN